MRHDAGVAGMLGVPLLAAIFWSWARLYGEMDDVPEDADYVAVQQILKQQGFVHGSDALAILPAWSLRPLVALGHFDPISSDALSVQPLDRYRRLWLVVEPDADVEHGLVQARFGAPTFRAAAGRVVVERYDLEPAEVTFDFAARLDEAHVHITGETGDPQACTQTGGTGFVCGPERWQRVSRQWLLVSENADRAVWSHPPARGQKLVIAWNDVLLGERLVVRAGFTRHGADRARAPVRMRIAVDGVQVAVVERVPLFGFEVETIPLGARAGGPASVTFSVDTDDNGASHFAWDAWSARGRR